MKFNILITLYLMNILVAFCSCQKWLDQKPRSELVTPTSLDDLQGLLDNANMMNRSLTPGLGESCTDNYFLTQARFDGLSNAPISKDFYLWKKTKYNFPNDWSKSYQPVYVANYCLERLEHIPVTQENKQLWNNIKGSALFYCSYNYLNLLWNYSKAYDQSTAKTDLGVVIREGSDFNSPSIRSNTEEGYQKVIQDAQMAIPLLPQLPSHVYRPSQCAAYALLARSFHSMQLYDSALIYATKALSLKDDLMNFSELDVASNFPFPEFNKEIIFYTEMYNALPNMDRGYFDTTLVSSFDSSDLRSMAYFRPSGGYFARKGTYAVTQGKFTGLATDEIILIRAECYLRVGNIERALGDYNYLLENRYISFIPVLVSDSEDLLTMILNERRKELINRGIRWMDIKRLNKAGANIVLSRKMNDRSYTLMPNDNFYALPLPDDIVRLSGIPQNP